MPTPSKPVLVLQAEGKSHRTKAEIEQRKKAEESLITGKRMQMWPEVKKDKTAAREFRRVKSLLAEIGKDDALYESVINRYASLRSECLEFEEHSERLLTDIETAAAAYANGDIEFLDYMQLKQKIGANITSIDRQLQAKRKMLLDIEKENIMTIAAALRTVPKTVEKQAPPSRMEAFLKRRDG